MRVLLLGLILLLLLGRWILLLLLMLIGVRVLGRVLLLRLKLLLGRELLVLLELLLVGVLLVLLRIVRIVVVLGHLLFLFIVGNVEWIPGEWVRRKWIFDFPFLCCGCSLVLILLSVLGHASKLG